MISAQHARDALRSGACEDIAQATAHAVAGPVYIAYHDDGAGDVAGIVWKVFETDEWHCLDIEVCLDLLNSIAVGGAGGTRRDIPAWAIVRCISHHRDRSEALELAGWIVP